MRQSSPPRPRRRLIRMLIAAAAGILMSTTAAVPAGALWLVPALQPMQLASLDPRHIVSPDLHKCIVPDVEAGIEGEKIKLVPCAVRNIPDIQKWVTIDGTGRSRLQNVATRECLGFATPPRMHVSCADTPVLTAWEYHELTQSIRGRVPTTLCLTTATLVTDPYVFLGPCLSNFATQQKWLPITAR